MNAPVLNRSTWITIMAMIGGCAVAGILLAHQSLFAMFSGKLMLALTRGVMGALLMSSAYLLSRYRNDLIDDDAR